MKNLILACFLFSLIFALYFLVSASQVYIVFFHFTLLFAALLFLFKKDWKTTLKSIGIPGNFRNNLAWTAIGFFSIIVLTIALNLLMLYIFGIQDSDKIVDKVSTLPTYLLFFAFLVAPFTEELFFRAFLYSRFGMIASSILFSLSHLAYGSIIEIVGTFVLGMFFCVIYQKSKSIVPCIAIHFLYNLMSLILMGMIFQ